GSTKDFPRICNAAASRDAVQVEMATDPFTDLGPEVAALFAAARETEPVSENPALFAAMAGAVDSGRLLPHTPPSRRHHMIGKVITAKAAAIAGAFILTSGVAAAATGTLPDPVQDVASDAADVVGVNIPEGNHGSKVSEVARDKSNDGDENHGKTVSETARDNHGHNKDDATTSTTVDDDDNSGPGNSNGAGKSEDSKASDNSKGRGGDSDDDDDDSTTSTTIDDDSDDDSDSDNDDDSDDAPDSDEDDSDEDGSGQNRGQGRDD
ncbi:MAG: hypothetical protein Q8K63_01320, partial [Acidimicrobiales bacterium]|nr:hypothetical protein [Acidimicrobiales bacterium]